MGLLPLLALTSLALPQTAAEAPKKIIDFGGGGWKDGQVNEPCILVNPKDRKRLIMFFSGMKHGGLGGSIGKAWATVDDPYTWHEDPENPFMSRVPETPFESSAIRLDTVLYDKKRDEYQIYYTGNNGEFAGKSETEGDAIGLATCPAGPDGYSSVTAANIRRNPSNPILSPKGQGRDDETYVSQGAVYREKGKWFCLYSYRTKDHVLPGVRLATSDDGIQWIKQPGPDILTSAPESRFIEWHQVYKIDSRYLLLYEGYNGGTRWGADLAVSDRLTDGWCKLPTLAVDQTTWPGYSSQTQFHVATPALYRIGRRWILFFQASHEGDYWNQNWSLWAWPCNDFVKNLRKLGDIQDREGTIAPRPNQMGRPPRHK